MKKKTEARGSGTLDPLIRARIEADKAWNAVKAAEKAWSAAAKKRTPEEWRTAIDGIADKLVRIQAACIVWWDYFGSRPASDPWPHLDDLRWAWKADHNADSKKVRKALMQAVAVDIGPGLFTGLRVGFTTAITIARFDAVIGIITTNPWICWRSLDARLIS